MATEQLIDQILTLASVDTAQFPAASKKLARLSFFDWAVCGIGGLSEEVSQNVLTFIKQNHASGSASLFGGGQSSPVSAALANGTIAHALDYDDTHFAHIGHLSVAIYPAALAVGQEFDHSINDVLDAYLAGAEAAIRIGTTLGVGHYERCFHQTATAGAFGATIAAGRLLGLSEDQYRAAIGLCSTRASGLKSQFGTMGKPLNAGFAASNGVECAKLAKLGMTSSDDGLQGQQGFIETHSQQSNDVLDHNRFLFEDIRYKLYACCHGTHAMIEALHEAKRGNDFSVDDVLKLNVRVHPKWLRVCNIAQPRTGLELKFSYSYLAGMVVSNLSCADPDTYTDQLCENATLRKFADKVSVTGDDVTSDTAASIALSFANGSQTSHHYDLMDPIEETQLEMRLREKALATIGERSVELWGRISNKGADSSRMLHVCL